MGRKRRRGTQPETAVSAPSSGRPQVPRTEWALLLALVALGFAVRVAVPAQMAVEHFDEGVYASNLWFGAENGYRYPDRHLFAPPLLPALIEWAMILFGQHAVIPMLINLLAGTLTVPLIWWTARRWFGPVAAGVAGLLCATSDIHILYSRTALTDPLLGFWLLLAVALFSEGMARSDRRWVIAAGVATGLAGWTKYSGWLPLAIALAGSLPWIAASEPARLWKNHLRSVLMQWLLLLGTAALVWSPVWLSLQDPQIGGYSAVSANHRQYLVGWSRWWDSLTHQAGYLDYFDGPLSSAGLLAGLLLPILLALSGRLPEDPETSVSGDETLRKELPDTSVVESDAARRRSPVDQGTGPNVPGSTNRPRQSPGILLAGILCGAAILTALAIGGGSSLPLALTSLTGLLLQLSASRCDSRSPDRAMRCRLGAWLTLAWWAGLALTTPLYTPYPRLTLPWLIAAWLGTAAGMDWLTRYFVRSCRRSVGPRMHRRWALATAVLLLTGIVLVPIVQSFHGVAWQDRTSLAHASRRLAEAARTDATRRPGASSGLAVYVFAEPAAFFHLSAEGILAGPISNLDFAGPTAEPLPVPTYLVVGPHAERTAGFAEEFARHASRFERLGTFGFQPSDLTLSNELPPATLRKHRDARQPVREELSLYRLR